MTLACIDTANHALALRALALSAANLQFARTVLFTDALPPVLVAPDNVEIVSIPPIRSRDAYSHFVLKDLAACISTSHVLVVQWDGYVINADAWEDAFLDVDYIGAPWTSIADGMRVGNGGFSLRSRRLLQALTDPAVTLHDAEDVTIGRIYRPWLEQTHGIRFADEAMASRFAFEAAYPIGMPFGFHGLFNFCRTVAPSQLGILVAGFSDTIIRSQQCRALLRNCLALAQWNPAIAIAGRMLEIESTDGEARNALTKAEAAAARGVGVGRNDPCPCGSGKRYKQCHGATNPGTGTSRPPPVAPQESPDAIVARGMTAHRAQDLADAERNYRQALSRAPDHPYALHYLGVILYQRGRPHEAMPMLDRAVAARPDEPEFHNNRGLALAALQRHAEADDAYCQALERNPGHALAWNNRGLTLQALGNVDAAVVAFRKALELTPDFAQGHWNLALALLLQGHHAEGLAEYEWRLRVPELAATLPVFAGPRWSGDDPRGKTLLLHAEQGAGDALQMLRFARTLANRGARVIVAVPPPMMRLAATVAGVSTAIAVNTPPPPYDAHISLMSLPHVLGITPIALEATVPYLRPDPQRVHEVQAAIELAAGRAFRIGIAWSGAAGNPNNAMRSLPLAMFAPLLDVPATCWFSLKWDVDAPGPTDASVSTRLAALPQRNDFDGLAALISELDLVITVDTSIAHLAGALGKPVWILLNRIPDWRWMLDREDSPWYPTARLFRQRTSGDWSAPVQEVADVLRVTLASRQVPR